MILTFADHEGDPVAVESASIVGISVGSLNGPRAATDTADITVTLVWCAGIGQPFVVAAPFAEVVAAWEAARAAGPPADFQGMHGWPVNWTDATLRLPGAAPWAVKAGRVT